MLKNTCCARTPITYTTEVLRANVKRPAGLLLSDLRVAADLVSTIYQTSMPMRGSGKDSEAMNHVVDSLASWPSEWIRTLYIKYTFMVSI